MHVPQNSMWQEIWKILQNFLETKQGLIFEDWTSIPTDNKPTTCLLNLSFGDKNC
jgi:hypothetical protein